MKMTPEAVKRLKSNPPDKRGLSRKSPTTAPKGQMGGVSKSVLTLNKCLIDVKEG